jgi:hypothetical protein
VERRSNDGSGSDYQGCRLLLLTFDDNGGINKKEWEKGMHLGMELLLSMLDGEHPKQVINAQHRFAKKRCEHEFK